MMLLVDLSRAADFSASLDKFQVKTVAEADAIARNMKRAVLYKWNARQRRSEEIVKEYGS